jgi:AcrB/AcrD/AcrF family
MLIGMAAKNAILIVEFAKLARERGTPLLEAALEGACLRLRTISSVCTPRVHVSRQLTPATFLLSAINGVFCK